MFSKKVLKSFSTQASKNYDIVIVGANIGGILSRQLETLLKKRFNVFVIYNNQYNQCNHLDIAFQQGYLSLENYYLNVSKTLSASTAHSDGVGIKQYLPSENAVELTNGTRISYKQLVVSTGLEQDLDQIKGLKDALEDNGHPVFGSYIDSIGKVETAKKPEHYYKFNGGKSYFYIPPFPIQGEGAHYNFFAAFDAWKANQKKLLSQTVFDSLDIEFQVINANSTFAEHSTGLNEFIIKELKSRGIQYQLNTQVHEIIKNERKISLTTESGENVKLDYDNFYTIIPTKRSQHLIDSKLAAKESNYLLDVNRETLQHQKYTNIFGLGDVCNVPTTKSFHASQQQLNVVRNNVFRNITGQYLNAFYDGYSKVPIYISNNKLTWFSHHYDNKKGMGSLIGSSGGWLSQLRYYTYSLTNPFWNSLYYSGKIYGTPTQLWFNKYGELSKIPEEQLQNLEIQNKSLHERFQAFRGEQLQVAFSASQQAASQQQTTTTTQQQTQQPKQQQQEQPKQQQQQQEQPKQQQQQQQQKQEEVQQQQKVQNNASSSKKTTTASEKYTKAEPLAAPAKKKRGRPKKNPGDVTEYE